MRAISSFSAISCILAYAAQLEGVLGGPASGHGEAIVKRASSHKNIARDIRERNDVSKATPHTLHKKKDGKIKRQCRLRPANSSALVANQQQNNHGHNTTHSSTVAHASSSSSSAASPSDTAHIDGVPDSRWKLQWKSSGRSFFDEWDFWSTDDPTHGTVQFLDRDSAFGRGLAYVDGDGYAYMKADTSGWAQNRASVRIHSQHVFNGNTLILMDSTHMPTGCGTWPAFWSNGPDWPYNGEIDIVEGVHDSNVNQASIHTGSGCWVNGNANAVGQLVGGNNCAAYESGNSGCGFRDVTYSNNYGQPFNDNGGGVYAMLWTDGGISVYFFPRNQIPKDIQAEKPNPDNWHAPIANWGADGCNPSSFFHDHFAIFDLTFCGDWAGNDWGHCSQVTGYGSCSEYVQNNPDAFRDAYWKVKYVSWYQLRW